MATDAVNVGYASEQMYIENPDWKIFTGSTYECRVLVCPEIEGGFSSHALRLPGVVSQGETIEEALANVSESFQGAIEYYRDKHQKIPWGDVEIDRPADSLERWILVDV